MLQGVEKRRDKHSRPFGRKPVYPISQVQPVFRYCRCQREYKNIQYGKIRGNRRYHHRRKIRKRTIAKRPCQIHSSHADQQHYNNKQRSFENVFLLFFGNVSSHGMLSCGVCKSSIKRRLLLYLSRMPGLSTSARFL